MKRIETGIVIAVMLAVPSSVSAQRVLYLTRHAQKDPDPSYDRRDARRPLTALGKEQAEALARRLDGADITAVYYSALAQSRGAEPIERTYTTAEPLIRALRARGIRVDTQSILYPEYLLHGTWDPAALERYAQGVLDRVGREHPDGVVLLVGHENTVPAILRELAWRAGKSIPAQSTYIAPDEFRLLFTVTPRATDLSAFFRREVYFSPSTPQVPSKALP
jgi:broad specificity phosphatase PhoE